MPFMNRLSMDERRNDHRPAAPGLAASGGSHERPASIERRSGASARSRAAAAKCTTRLKCPPTRYRPSRKVYQKWPPTRRRPAAAPRAVSGTSSRRSLPRAATRSRSTKIWSSTTAMPARITRSNVSSASCDQAQPKISCRFETEPGQEVQVDYGEGALTRDPQHRQVSPAAAVYA